MDEDICGDWNSDEGPHYLTGSVARLHEFDAWTWVLDATRAVEQQWGPVADRMIEWETNPYA